MRHALLIYADERELGETTEEHFHVESKVHIVEKRGDRTSHRVDRMDRGGSP